MSGFGNSYYKVSRRFRIFQNVGSSPSNSYIGSSRASDAVLKAVNTTVGDEIHSLVGGLFHVCAKTGQTHSINLVLPKRIFEKSYGANPETTREDDLNKAGYLEERSSPSLKADYKEAIETSSQQHPELTGGIVVVDKDPLEEVSEDIIAALQIAGADIRGSNVKFYDRSAHNPAMVKFSIGDDDVEWKLILSDLGTAKLISPETNNDFVSVNYLDKTISSAASEMIDLINMQNAPAFRA